MHCQSTLIIPSKHTGSVSKEGSLLVTPLFSCSCDWTICHNISSATLDISYHWIAQQYFAAALLQEAQMHVSRSGSVALHFPPCTLRSPTPFFADSTDPKPLLEACGGCTVRVKALYRVTCSSVNDCS